MFKSRQVAQARGGRSDALQLIAECLSYITPARMNVIAVSPDFAPMCTQTEKWGHNKFCSERKRSAFSSLDPLGGCED